MSVKIAMASDAALWAGGTLFGPDVKLVRPWKHDSKEVAPGDAFVALIGDRTDGHLYVNQALERGAQLLLVEESKFAEIGLNSPDLAGLSVIAVHDTSCALADIARNYLQSIAPQVVAITGSVGKTTTREMSVAVLSKKFRVHGAVRSFNTLIGCSLTILAMPEDTEVLVLEFGANRFGEIRELAENFEPHIAVITEVAPAHLEGFKDITGVLNAKTEIFASDFLSEIYFNADNEMLEKSARGLKKKAKHVAVGRSENAECKISGIDLSLDSDGPLLKAVYSYEEKKYEVTAPLFGAQHAYNMGYALCIGKALGVDEKDICGALNSFRPIAGRGAVKRFGFGSWVVDEAYNANPVSVSAAIDNVKNTSGLQGYKLYAVLGGMKELGDKSARLHTETAKKFNGFERVILYGSEWKEVKKLPENTVICCEMQDVIAEVLNLDSEKSVILVKGSNSYNLKKIVGLLTEGTNVY